MKTFSEFVTEMGEAYEKATPQQIRQTAKKRSMAMKRQNKKQATQMMKDRTMKKRKDDSAMRASARNKVLKRLIPNYDKMDAIQKAKKKEMKKARIDTEIKKEIPKVRKAEPERIKKHKENLKSRLQKKK